jgi:hypothetical protein
MKMRTTIITICKTCCEELTLIESKFYGRGINDQCKYEKDSCRFCCECNGHK